MSLDDDILRMYIDQIYQVNDYDRNGTLDIRQMHTFFNQLYAQLNQPRRFTQAEFKLFFNSVDLQQDGRITKPELFRLFKSIWDNPNPALLPGNQYGQNTNQYGQQYGQQYNPNPYGQQQYNPNQYGANQYNANQGNQYQQPKFNFQGQGYPYGQGQNNYNNGSGR